MESVPGAGVENSGKSTKFRRTLSLTAGLVLVGFRTDRGAVPVGRPFTGGCVSMSDALEKRDDVKSR